MTAGGTSRRRRAAALAVGAATLVLIWAAAGSFGGNGKPARAVGGPSPGQAAASVVSHFLALREAGQWAAACRYFAPGSPARTQCLHQVGNAESGLSYTGTVSVPAAVAEGSHALVSVTGQICVSDSRFRGQRRCVANADPAAGMPGTKLSFQTAYALAVSKAHRSFSPWPCQRVHGVWYLVPVTL